MKSFLSALLLIASQASAQASTPQKSVDIYSSFDTPGYNEIDPAGKKTGFEIELAEAIFASQGYSVNWLEKSWDDIVADMKRPSADKNYLYIASVESRPDRRAFWLFAPAVEFDASHYFFSNLSGPVQTGNVVDTSSGKTVPNFVLDVEANRVQGRKLRIATWKGSVFEKELRQVFPNPVHVEILPMTEGDPMVWLEDGSTDLVYAFASGPKNPYSDRGFKIAGGPITNFDLDRFGGTSPVLPLNSFGQEMSRVWTDGYAAIIRDDTFFKISMRWFGRVSWPFEFNGFMIQDETAFRERIREFEARARSKN